MWGWNESGQLGLPSRGLEEEKRRTNNGKRTKIYLTLHMNGLQHVSV